MGLCLMVKKTEDDLQIGYGSYFWLRVYILNSIEDGLGDEFKECCFKNKYFSESFIKRLVELKLDKFILHSDCEGRLRYKQITKILKALKKVDFKNESWKKNFDELKKLFQIAVDNRSSIIYF